eukprot:6027572-Ditylum_brightwellii.AAC.1
MFPEDGLGGKCVKEVFEKAMNDYTPFAEEKKEKMAATTNTVTEGVMRVNGNTASAASSSSSPATVDWIPSNR